MKLAMQRSRPAASTTLLVIPPLFPLPLLLIHRPDLFPLPLLPPLQPPPGRAATTTQDGY